MKKMINRIKDRFYYSYESIKNRYPCKIIKIEHLDDFSQETIITFRAVTKLNVRKMKLKDLIDDNLLIEKFHPTDCIKMGFVAMGDILLKNNDVSDDIRNQYSDIIAQLFKDIGVKKEGQQS